MQRAILRSFSSDHPLRFTTPFGATSSTLHRRRSPALLPFARFPVGARRYTFFPLFIRESRDKWFNAVRGSDLADEKLAFSTLSLRFEGNSAKERERERERDFRWQWRRVDGARWIYGGWIERCNIGGRVITALSIHERTEINRARPLIGAHPRAGLDRVVGVNWEWIYLCVQVLVYVGFPDGVEESERRLSTFYSPRNCWLISYDGGFVQFVTVSIYCVEFLEEIYVFVELELWTSEFVRQKTCSNCSNSILRNVKLEFWYLFETWPKRVRDNTRDFYTYSNIFVNILLNIHIIYRKYIFILFVIIQFEYFRKYIIYIICFINLKYIQK